MPSRPETGGMPAEETADQASPPAAEQAHTDAPTEGGDAKVDTSAPAVDDGA